MNILALVFALILMLSLLTIERLEKVKSQTIIQKEYRTYLTEQEGVFFNLRQSRLYEERPRTLQVLPFTFLIDKTFRENSPEKANQYKLMLALLIKELYGKAAFFKKAEKNHSNLIEDLINQIEKVTDLVEKKSLFRGEDLSKLDLEDPELQDVWYHILKGSIDRDKLATAYKKEPNLAEESEWKEKAYPSLLTFITRKQIKIPLQRAPYEVLKAIFPNDEIVTQVIQKRQELAESKDDSASNQFKDEFAPKIRDGLSEDLFDFKITKGADRSIYD